jgi:diguanylate cyclase (GGDEF)-like protein/PAS domain S-box-containing protein
LRFTGSVKSAGERRLHGQVGRNPRARARASGLRLPALGLLDWIPDGVVVADVHGTIVFANESMETITGFASEDLVGCRIEVLVPPKLRPAHRAHRRDYQSGRAGPMAMRQAGHDFPVRRKDGAEISAEITLGAIDIDGRWHSVSVIRDISERRNAELALERQATHDPLTGMANRTLFLDRLEQALLAARRERRQVALVMLDLDGFKGVNDAFGHAAGDDVLRAAGHRLASGLRASDTAARIGGDEFAWVLPRIAGQDAVERSVRKRLRALDDPFRIGRKLINISASAGIALYPQGGRDADSLMSHADSALYAAKREGRGLVLFRPLRRNPA